MRDENLLNNLYDSISDEKVLNEYLEEIDIEKRLETLSKYKTTIFERYQKEKLRLETIEFLIRTLKNS